MHKSTLQNQPRDEKNAAKGQRQDKRQPLIRSFGFIYGCLLLRKIGIHMLSQTIVGGGVSGNIQILETLVERGNSICAASGQQR